MGQEHYSDKELLQLASLGDREIARNIVEKFSPILYQYFLAFHFPEDQAEDLVEETWMNFWASAANFQGRSSLKTWILSIAHHMAQRDFQRKRRNSSFFQAIVFHARNFLFQAKDPEEALIREESKLLVNMALATLPEQFREVLFLQYMKELSLQDIATIVGIPEGTVKSRIFKAKQLLKKKLLHFQEHPHPSFFYQTHKALNQTGEHSL